jgi:hypothetical protein
LGLGIQGPPLPNGRIARMGELRLSLGWVRVLGFGIQGSGSALTKWSDRARGRTLVSLGAVRVYGSEFWDSGFEVQGCGVQGFGVQPALSKWSVHARGRTLVSSGGVRVLGFRAQGSGCGVQGFRVQPALTEWLVRTHGITLVRLGRVRD